MSEGQRGNILFLVLLAVVLFAALSYAVTQSQRGAGNDASNEKVQAQAAELMNYFTSIDVGVQRMLTTGGIKDYELNFFYQIGNNYIFGSNDNTNCTEARCRVFDPAGGGVTGRRVSTAFFRDPSTASSNNLDTPRLVYATMPGAGSSKTDVMLWIGGVSTALCKEINKRAGLGNDIFYNINDAATTNTIMYQFNIPVGPIPDNIYTSSNSIEAGMAGSYCSCPYASQSLCETTSPFRPSIVHIILAR